MDTKRFILLVALGLVSTMIWQTWQQDYAPALESGVESQAASRSAAGAEAVAEPEQQAANSAGVPKLPSTGAAAAQQNPDQSADAVDGEIVTVRTDLLTVEIDTRGGGVSEVRLPQYPVSVNRPDEPFVLMTDDGPLYYTAQGGVLSQRPAPDHKALYQAEQTEYSLTNGADSLEVRLHWRDDSGIAIDKVFVFHRNRYVVDVRYEIKNQSSQAWRGWAYGQLTHNSPDDGGMSLIYTYTGAALSGPDDRYQKISFDDMREQKMEREIVNGWAAMLQHYFVAALIPADQEAAYRYHTEVLNRDATNNQQDSRYIIGMTTPAAEVAAGGTATLGYRLYVGPKEQHRLEKLAPGLELTVDYGMLWFLAKPLYWGMEKLHALTGNWGVAIILLTLLIKVAFYKLSAAGYKSMARMRKVQPRLLALRERYKDDKQRLNQAMMDLYKTEKINPLGGCLPILVQIPVFIALYWVLLESVELRQAPFILWIQDLSIPDPWYVLPLIMGVTMFFQQKLNPTPIDPVQEKVMMALPVVFTVFFAFFPAGLVLYWIVNNILSIGQQWLITRNLEKSGH